MTVAAITAMVVKVSRGGVSRVKKPHLACVDNTLPYITMANLTIAMATSLALSRCYKSSVCANGSPRNLGCTLLSERATGQRPECKGTYKELDRGVSRLVTCGWYGWTQQTPGR